MIFEQFKYYLDAYGASLRRWPPEARVAAEAFLQSSPAARAAQAEVRRLDLLLDRQGGPHPEGDTVRRLIEQVSVRAAVGAPARSAAGPRSRLASLWSRAAVLAVVALLAVATGVVRVQQETGDASWSELAQMGATEAPLEVAGL